MTGRWSKCLPTRHSEFEFYIIIITLFTLLRILPSVQEAASHCILTPAFKALKILKECSCHFWTGALEYYSLIFSCLKYQTCWLFEKYNNMKWRKSHFCYLFSLNHLYSINHLILALKWGGTKIPPTNLPIISSVTQSVWLCYSCQEENATCGMLVCGPGNKRSTNQESVANWAAKKGSFKRLRQNNSSKWVDSVKMCRAHQCRLSQILPESFSWNHRRTRLNPPPPTFHYSTNTFNPAWLCKPSRRELQICAETRIGNSHSHQTLMGTP